MRTSKNTTRGLAASAILLVLLALAVPTGAQAAALGAGPPRVATGTVTHVHGTSGLLQATVNPRGLETTYFFQYGPTLAYGSATPTATVPTGTTAIKVGQTISGLLVGFHYRVVATNSAGQTLGRDRVFAPHTSGNKIEVPKETRVDVYGSPFLISGRLTGLNVGGRRARAAEQPLPVPRTICDRQRSCHDELTRGFLLPRHEPLPERAAAHRHARPAADLQRCDDRARRGQGELPRAQDRPALGSYVSMAPSSLRPSSERWYGYSSPKPYGPASPKRARISRRSSRRGSSAPRAPSRASARSSGCAARATIACSSNRSPARSRQARARTCR